MGYVIFGRLGVMTYRRRDGVLALVEYEVA